MKKIILVLILSIILCIVLYFIGCYSDYEEIAYPGQIEHCEKSSLKCVDGYLDYYRCIVYTSFDDDATPTLTDYFKVNDATYNNVYEILNSECI